MAKPALDSLFKELDTFIKDNELEKAINVCDKILQNDPNENDAFQCKVVALIQLSKFDDAINLLEKSSLGSNLTFEKAYCLYRNRKFQDCLSILNTFPEPKPFRVQQLEAQVHYRLEDYSKSIKVYESLISQQKSTTPELKTNLAAAYASAGIAGKELETLVSASRPYLEESYEFSYNIATAYLDVADYKNAEKYLKQAEKVCNKSMKDEGASEQEIEDELAVVRTQLAFLHHIQGRTEEALELYNSVLKNKPSDEAVIAVASNNVVAIKKEHELFDSFKKLKQATSQSVDTKLTSHQKKIIGFNKCLLLLYMNKGDQCREMVNQLKDQFPNSDKLALLSASLLFREKKVQKSEEVLRTFAAEHPESSTHVQLALAQLQLGNGNFNEAISALKSIKELRNRAGMVGTLVALLEHVRDYNGAIQILEEYVNFLDSRYQKNKNQQQQDDEDQYVAILKEIASYMLHHHRYKEAASTYERVLKVVPNDLEALPGLVIACSQFDPKLAEKHNARIPPLASAKDEAEIDAQALEGLSAPRFASKAAAVAQDSNKIPDESRKLKDKKKKKKKKKLPKDLTKPIDPERWLPLKQRSYYKKRTKKGGKLEKGSQGFTERKLANSSVSATATATATASTTPASNAANQPAAAAVAQEKPQAAKPQQAPAQQQHKKKKNKRR